MVRQDLEYALLAGAMTKRISSRKEELLERELQMGMFFRQP